MDLFSVPLGTVPPDEPEESVGLSSVPSNAYEYRGKWLALRNVKIVAAYDTERELYTDPIIREPGVTIFHPPASDIVVIR